MPPLGGWLPWSGHLTMPLFVMVSGHLTFGRVRPPAWRWLLRKARMLLVPWAVWTIAYFFILRDPFIVTSVPFPAYLTAELLSPSLWYLPVLFGCYVLVASVARLGDWALPLAGLLLLPATFAWLPLLAWYWWWFVAGYFVAKYKDVFPRPVWPIVAGVVVVYALVAIGVPEATIPARVFFGIAGAAVGLAVAGPLARVRAGKVLAYVGVRSLPIYTAQFLFVQLELVPSAANIVLTSVLAVAGSLALEWVCSRNRLTNAMLLGGRTPAEPALARG